MKQLLLILLLLCYNMLNAQLFVQNFESSNNIVDYVGTSPGEGQFSAMSPDVTGLTHSITNGALRIERTASSSIYFYRNFTFATNPAFVQLKFDFEATNIGTITNPLFMVLIGSNFSASSNSQTSSFASRFGFRPGTGTDALAAYSIDNIGGAPGSASFTGKQTITFVVNNSGVSQTYNAPNATNETIETGKMDVWIGTSRGINDFSLKNTDPLAKGAISGFKIQSGLSTSGTGVFKFDNFEFKDLAAEAVIDPSQTLQPTPAEYLNFKHPFIWTSYSDRNHIVDNIKGYKWSKSLFAQLKSRIDPKKEAHNANRAASLGSIRALPGITDDRYFHTGTLNSMAEASILYYITNDSTYAQYASDILNHYVKYLATVAVKKYASETVGIFFESWWLESRTLFPRVAMSYDYLYNYLKGTKNTVYDLKTNTFTSFDEVSAQKAMKNMTDIVFKSITAPQSNHSVLAGNGALYPLLMINDDVVREQYFNRFLYGVSGDATHRFDEYISWTLKNFTSNKVWPETFGYSNASHQLVMQSMEVIDRYKPSLNILNNNLPILDGYIGYANYIYPSDEIIRFGDTGTGSSLSSGFRYMMKIAKRKNLPAYQQLAIQNLKYAYDKAGAFNPQIETDNLEWDNPLLLLWTDNIDANEIGIKPTVNATYNLVHAGIVVQRNFNTTDTLNNGMMYYTGGKGYVHAHATGIDMELYGKGLVMGAESGSGDYSSAEHDNYRVRHASHNTVIANGSGKEGSSWSTTNSSVALLSCEPKHGETPISTDFMFSIQNLNDDYNNSYQQRTNSILRTSNSTGYYFDMYRSKGKTTNNYHDYIFHNVGDSVHLKFTDGTLVPLAASTKYSTDLSGSVTGWKYFENVNSSVAITNAVKATFMLNSIGKYTHVFMPGQVSREYATAKGPTTKGAQKGYDTKKTPIITVRQRSEAWENPFISIFEHTNGTTNTTVQSVSNLLSNSRIVGAAVVSVVDGVTITDYIISNDVSANIINIADIGLNFDGRFAIVRTKTGANINELTLYIGEGSKLVFGSEELVADASKKALKTVALNTALRNVTNNNTMISVFPNPANRMFTIQTQLRDIKRIAIVDVSGRIILENNSGAQQISIDSNAIGLHAGLYFVKVMDKQNRTFVHKLTINE